MQFGPRAEFTSARTCAPTAEAGSDAADEETRHAFGCTAVKRSPLHISKHCWTTSRKYMLHTFFFLHRGSGSQQQHLGKKIIVYIKPRYTVKQAVNTRLERHALWGHTVRPLPPSGSQRRASLSFTEHRLPRELPTALTDRICGKRLRPRVSSSRQLP